MISNETIQKVNDLDILHVISPFINLKKKGSNYVACCPFHTEKSPSFTVSSAKDMYKCFGCGASGNGISFIMAHERKNYRKAVEFICLTNDIKFEEEKEKSTVQPPARLEKISKEFISWFENRGISNNTLLMLKITQSNEFMFKADKVIPVICFNYFIDDQLINIKYRGADKDFKLNKDSKLIFYNLDALKGETTGIIVEGEIDCLSLHEAKVYNSISVPNGANINGAINTSYIDNSWEQMAHIKKWVLCTDNDPTGNRLKEELSIKLGRNNCHEIEYPKDCKDANDILIKYGSKELKNIIDSASPIIKAPKKTATFPFEVFPKDIENSFIEVANEYSIPVNYFGVTALFTLSAMSGSMYSTEVPIQNIIFGMLIGPSGLGKSPAYNLICGDIVEPLEERLFDDWKRAYKEWDDRRQDAKHAKPPQAFKEEKPVRRVRTAKGGTMEGIQSHAATSPAGFGLYYDEGGKMLGSPNAYKKQDSSVDFWNELWNGKYFSELRSDSERERFASKTRVSVLIGMQTDRVKNHFTKDTTDSGLAFRFLFTQADYIPLNENVDHFSPKRDVCDDWKYIVRYLFKRGAYDYFKDDQPTHIPFTDVARLMYNQISEGYISNSNKLRQERKVGDSDEMLIGYESKLYSYMGRFMVILAILEDQKNPVIGEKEVDGAFKLYNFFREQARILFSRLNDDNVSDLSESERKMIELLPDREFNRDDINRVTKELQFSDKFFDMAYRRKYKMGWIKKISKGKYIKD